MKNNKGFTLVEVLATLIILSIIGLIITPIITDLINESRNTISKEQREVIIRSSKKWAVAKMDDLPTTNDAKCLLSLKQLKKSGYYEDRSVVVDPKTGDMNGYIQFTYKADTYDYDIVYLDTIPASYTKCVDDANW